MNKKGQESLLGIMGLIALIVIWLLLSPFFHDFIADIIDPSYGGVVNFFIKIFPWVGLITLIFLLIRKIQGAGSRQ